MILLAIAGTCISGEWISLLVRRIIAPVEIPAPFRLCEVTVSAVWTYYNQIRRKAIAAGLSPMRSSDDAREGVPAFGEHRPPPVDRSLTSGGILVRRYRI